jgi:hypothetical protein
LPSFRSEPRIDVLLPNIHGAAHHNEKVETVEGWDRFTGVEFYGRPLMTLLRPQFPKYSRARELDVLEEYPFWSVGAFSLSYCSDCRNAATLFEPRGRRHLGDFHRTSCALGEETHFAISDRTNSWKLDLGEFGAATVRFTLGFGLSASVGYFPFGRRTRFFLKI